MDRAYVRRTLAWVAALVCAAAPATGMAHWCSNIWTSPSRILVKPEKRQDVLDALQGFLGGSENARINVLPIEVTLPRVEEEAAEAQQKKAVLTTREELYQQIEKGSRLDGNHMLMVFFSTVVAAIGLVENNVAVVVGAMVIAPLLV